MKVIRFIMFLHKANWFRLFFSSHSCLICTPLNTAQFKVCIKRRLIFYHTDHCNTPDMRLQDNHSSSPASDMLSHPSYLKTSVRRNATNKSDSVVCKVRIGILVKTHKLTFYRRVSIRFHYLRLGTDL